MWLWCGLCNWGIYEIILDDIITVFHLFPLEPVFSSDSVQFDKHAVVIRHGEPERFP